MARPKVGNLAPKFALKNQDDKNVSLRDLLGKNHVVLYFYPKAMTPGCTTQACGLRDAKAELSRHGAVALGVSPDPVARLAKFREKEGLNFDLLSDEDHQLADKYGVWGLKKFMGREYMGVNRMTFVIGKDGRLKHVIEKVKTKTHHDDVLEILQSLD